MSEHPAIVTDLYIGVTEVGVCVCPPTFWSDADWNG